MKPAAYGVFASLVVWAGLLAQSGTHDGPLFGDGSDRPSKDPAPSTDTTPIPSSHRARPPADDSKAGDEPAPKAAVEAPDNDKPIEVSVNVVNVMASVRDKHNTLIPNLTKDDFELFENGQQQTIKYFSRESNLPLTIGLLIDVSRSQENLIGVEQRAGSAFLDSVLRPKDEAFILSFGADTELLQDITSSKSMLHRGLDNLKPNFGFSGITPGPVPTATQQAGTLLYDAVYLAASDRLAREAGRKTIVVITDGDDEGSRLSIKKAIEAAQKSDVVIYSIYYVDHYQGRGGGFSFGGGGRGYLSQMSGETGGHVYDVGGRNSLDKIFDELQQEMRTQYAIGYTPTDPKKDGSYRKLEIRTKDRSLKVQARKGYYAVPNEAP
jgi:VWFA-related protein